ncbi:nose resistant to fluoxetine protein 6-like [Homalodisca vitripennis]|uniref:nose resistant to fluoxetine protein 6-like n=1 Tax=Homalodisca vitripennis TaxID=197043 RepID=UPI001EECC5BD|nr:nose resistant to fluoxetine protein 6-like [Homalodisca vitripennis]
MSRMKEVQKVLLPMPENVLQEVTFHAGSNYILLDSKTELCRNHSSLMFESFLNFDFWALRMVDASSKLPSGVLDGHIMDLGSYDQCLSVEAPGKIFVGQMCVVEARGFFPDTIDKFNAERPFMQPLREDLLFSVCVPSSCTAQDVSAHLNIALNSVNASAIVYDSSCSSNIPVPLKANDWIAILLIAVVILLVILSTVYENSSLGSEKNAILCAFSLKTNVTQMLSTRASPTALTCLNGLRVLAIFWIMTGHRMLQMLSFPKQRGRDVYEVLDGYSWAPVESTQLAVEIFFLISGILVTYGYLNHKLKGLKFNIPTFYLYRYLRLTPPLAAIVLLYGTLAIRFTDGPLWRRVFDRPYYNCRHNWWATLLYVNNYYDPYRMCVSQSWFVSSDFQLYLFSPILLIPLHKRPKLGLALTAMFVLITTMGGLWNAIVNDLKGGMAVSMDRRSEDATVQDYIVTHWRAASFLIGMALGYFLFKIKQGDIALKLSRAKLWAGWMISTFFILFVVIFVTVLEDPEYVPNAWVDISYMIFHRHVFTLGIVWIVLVCTLGHGGWVNQFLSWNTLIPFARLSYGAFLTHLLIQTLENFSQRVPISVSHKHLWYHVAGDFTLTYIASAVLYLTVEGPCSNITNWCFQGQRKTKENLQNHTELPVHKEKT